MRDIEYVKQGPTLAMHKWVLGVPVSAGLQDKASAMTSDCANPDLTGPRMISIPCINAVVSRTSI